MKIEWRGVMSAADRAGLVPAQVKELADEHPNLESVKKSSADARRVAGTGEWCVGRLVLGLDDCALEGVAMEANL